MKLHRRLFVLVTSRMILLTSIALLSREAYGLTHKQSSDQKVPGKPSEDCEATSDGQFVCHDTPDELKPACIDTHEHCAFWAEHDECTNNPNYMLTACRKSCNNCPKKILPSEHTTDQDMEITLSQVANYGISQQIPNDSKASTLRIARQTISYMNSFVHAETPTHRMSDYVLSKCKNLHENCTLWASTGECNVNAAYMVTNCAPSCRSCHLIDFETRCPDRDPDVSPCLHSGELNNMFENLVNHAPGNTTEQHVSVDGMPSYTVNVHSRPNTDSTDIIDKERDRTEDPWVVTLDHFLTEIECEHLIQLGYQYGYERSKDVGPKKFDGSFNGIISETRTSENAWCSALKGCRDDPVVQRILARMETVTGISPDNSEDFQLLKYDVGQFYRLHHDYIEHQRDRSCGPRILTCFFYLSDVEDGGGTRFSDLNITIHPKMGRALLWPSVFNYDLLEKDGRTRHEALEVGKGVKFAANAWIHLYNHVQPQKDGCS